MHPDTWRLIITSPNNGAWNMALDEAIFNTTAKKIQPPTLRLYAWSPYCLSLGYAQNIGEVNQEALTAEGWDLVRRPTGGRAILHADELTYSVCAPLSNPHIQGGVIESYRRLSNILLLALGKLEVIADSKPKNNEEKHLAKDPVCFQYPSDYEITYNRKKIIGSAQARKANALLQHGSIPLTGDITRILKVLNFDSEEKRNETRKKLIARASTLEEVTGIEISPEEATKAIIEAFEERLYIKFIQESVSDLEFSETQKLIKDKYAHPRWTERI